MTEIFDTIVIGAGWSGLAAARDLNDQRRSVVVLEASDHVGGRTIGKPFPGLDKVVHADLGGAWINREIQPLMRAEVARYGAALKEDLPVETPVFRIGGRNRLLPVPQEQLGDLERAMTHVTNASRRIIPSRPMTSQALSDLDVSIDDFFAPLNLPGETLEFIQSMLSMYTGAAPGKGSMVGFIGQAAAFGHSAFGFFGALTERFVRGPEALLRDMVVRDRLEVRFGNKVTRIEQTSDGVTVRTEGGVTIDARTCIVAVPTNVLRHIEFAPGLSPEKNSALADNHLSRAYKCIILARNLPSGPLAIGSDAFQALFMSTKVTDGTYVLIGFGAEGVQHMDLTDNGQVEKAVRAYFPQAEVLAVEAHNWNDDPLFDGTWRIDPGGAALPFLTAMNQHEGRIVFAGTDIDDSVWRTWIEGALNSAKQAVSQVAIQLRQDDV
ncbi:flavin monoamine oxidase family protein [Rhodococcus sp. NPDC057014]|uniref:flavin monoamine oxidase family protein n=1 Tax=Rhodococcus sp. NPDC057014 TaxID=3346000 RepID=UPI00363DC2CA